MNAIVNVPICPLLSDVDNSATQVDELLFGWGVEILGEAIPGVLQVRTDYNYIGFARSSDLVLGGEAWENWTRQTRQIFTSPVRDVLAAPRVDAPRFTTLTRGAVVALVGDADEEGWQRIRLPDDWEGYTKCNFLGNYCESTPPAEPVALRRAIADAAMGYLGAPYRWGGKTPLGIDCSGLTFMAYWLNGIKIFRDSRIEPGFPVRKINREAMDTGDLLYFPGHVALYLGEGKYIHATARTGSDGVVINSLNPEDADYRSDLAENLIAVGSIFPLEQEAENSASVLPRGKSGRPDIGPAAFSIFLSAYP